jgi:hypothetical protein
MDIPVPLKFLINRHAYQEIEIRIQEAILAKFNLPKFCNSVIASVLHVDKLLVRYEMNSDSNASFGTNGFSDSLFRYPTLGTLERLPPLDEKLVINFYARIPPPEVVANMFVSEFEELLTLNKGV